MCCGFGLDKEANEVCTVDQVYDDFEDIQACRL